MRCIAHSQRCWPASREEPAGRIARYAVGSDYHVALRQRLEGLASDLAEAGLPAGATAYVDDRPLAERALAARAGLAGSARTRTC